MSFTYSADHTRRRITVVMRSDFTLAQARAVANRQVAEGQWNYALLYDVSASRRTLDPSEVHELVEHIAQLSERHGCRGRVAMVAPEAVVFGIGRMYSVLAESTGMDLQLFRDRPSAEAWLGGGITSESSVTA